MMALEIATMNMDPSVLQVATEPAFRPLDKQFLLCLSGGGFRAMLFHAGAVRRLVELGAFRAGGVLEISSVSGGSILNGLFATHWDKIKDGDLHAYDREILSRALHVSTHGIDVLAVFRSFVRGTQPARVVAQLYEAAGWKSPDGTAEALLPRTPLSDLPYGAGVPRFVFNATDLNSGKRWTFSRTQCGHDEATKTAPVSVHTGRGKVDLAQSQDGKPGRRAAPPPIEVSPDALADAASYGDPAGASGPAGGHSPGASTITVAEAVAASGAFPPVLSPLIVDVARRGSTADGGLESHVLVDGGVHDNLGLDVVRWADNVLISDAGGTFDPESRVGFTLGPVFVPAQLMRVFNVVDARSRSQVRDWVWRILRNPTTLSDPDHARQVAYWPMDDTTMREELKPPGASAPVLDFVAPDHPAVLDVHPEMAHRLARTPTRLAPISEKLAWQLVNLGYARCDYYVRTMAKGWVKSLGGAVPPPVLPFAQAPLDRAPVPLPTPTPAAEVRLAYLLVALMALGLILAGALASLFTSLMLVAGWNGLAVGIVSLLIAATTLLVVVGGALAIVAIPKLVQAAKAVETT